MAEDGPRMPYDMDGPAMHRTIQRLLELFGWGEGVPGEGGTTMHNLPDGGTITRRPDGSAIFERNGGRASIDAEGNVTIEQPFPPGTFRFRRSSGDDREGDDGNPGFAAAEGDDDVRTTALLLKPTSEWSERDAAHVPGSSAFGDRDHPEYDSARYKIQQYDERRRSGMRTADRRYRVV